MSPATPGRRGFIIGLLLATLSPALGAIACRRRPPSPEERVRQLIGRLEAAVEGKDLDPVREALAERFRDSHDGDRTSALASLRALFLRHPSIHLFVRVRDIEVGGGEARAELAVAMASVPLGGADELARAQADLYQFTLTCAEKAPGGDFEVIEAVWSPTGLETFL